MADVSTPLGDFVKGISEFWKEMLDTWKKTEVHLGVIGDPGNGKSSFINAIRG